MRFTPFIIALFVFVFALPATSEAQATATAVQPLALSVFAGGTESYIGLDKGKNTDVAVGIDLRIKSYKHFVPSAEVRGYKPFHDGNVAAEENAVGGIRIERAFEHLHAAHPYADFLFGRGKIVYHGGEFGAGYVPDEGVTYISTVSNVLSPGAGVDIDITHYFSLKLDAQFQRYATHVTTSGKVWAKPITVGVVYRFDFNHHARATK